MTTSDAVGRGGRAILTGSSATWLIDSPYPDFQNIGIPRTPVAGKSTYQLDQAIPKAKALAERLAVLGRPPTIEAPQSDLPYTTIGFPARSWVLPLEDKPTPIFTFNTPIGKAPSAQCGRIAYVPGTIGRYDMKWPDACEENAHQYKNALDELQFLLLDASACIVDDKTAPSVPR
jgi:hypothetical protein